MMGFSISGKAALATLVLVGAPVALTIGYEPENYLLESTPELLESIQELEGVMNPEHLAFLGVVLGKTSLPDVMRKFGPAGQIEVGQHGDLVCYRSTDSGDNTMVTFSADMHGGQSVYNFQLIAGHQPFKSRKQCIPSSHISKAVATNSGIKLGLTTAAFKQLVGVPMVETKGHFFLNYTAYHDKPYKENPGRDKPGCLEVYTSLEARFENDKLVWILAIRGIEGYPGSCIRDKAKEGAR